LARSGDSEKWTQQADSLGNEILELNAFIGSQYRQLKKNFVKVDRMQGGKGDSVEQRVRVLEKVLYLPLSLMILLQLLTMKFANIGFGDLISVLSDVRHTIRGLDKGKSPRLEKIPTCFHFVWFL